MLERTVVLKDGPFVGAECALCKQPFNPGDEIILCPVDQTAHHVPCWQANAGRCASLACAGQGMVAGSGMGEIGLPAPPVRPSRPVFTPRPRPEPQEEPRIGRYRPLLRGCLFLGVMLLSFLLASACFGLWFLWQSFSTPVLPGDLPTVIPALLTFAILRG